MNGPLTYELRHPIQQTYSGANHGETRTETISTVTLRRPTGKDLLLMDDHQNKPMLLTLAMIAALSDLTMRQVERLDAEDVGPLGELAMSAVGSGPRTGENV